MRKTNLYLIIVALTVASCAGNESQVNTTANPTMSTGNMREDLIASNKQRMLAEMEQINSWVERRGFQMNDTQTGLKWMVLAEGTGPKPRLLSEVELKYTIHSLEDEYIYSSDSSGTLKLVVGQSDEPSGLQEGLLLIPEGTKARFVIPYFLAYGLTGDGDKIGNAMSLVYDVELLHVHNN